MHDYIRTQCILDRLLTSVCSEEEVLKAVNQLQKKIHPDMNRDVKTERLSQLVNEAKDKILKSDFV